MPSQAHTFTARWIFPADRPPLAHGTITVEGETIAAVEPQGKRRPTVNLGNVAIIPGLVNAHTHLDLSGMRGLCPPTPDFPAWLRSVVQHRRGQTAEQTAADIRSGLAECQRHGTTLVGDISGQGLSWPFLENAPLRAVVFLELLGLPADRAHQAYQQAVSWRTTHADSDQRRAGLSPHAPYSVNINLFKEIAEERGANGFERQRQSMVAIHLAETRQELNLLETREGPLAEFLKDLGVWHPEGLARSTAEIVGLYRQAPNVLFIHGNYLELTERMEPTIVYCPRTHAAFGHPPHPFRDGLARGIRIALGTDSLASNPDLDVLAEARFVHRLHPDLPGETLLRMATLDGAAALGWQTTTGSLTPGKSADLVVLPLPKEDAEDPHRLIFESAEKVQRLMFRGIWHECGEQ